MRLRLAIAPTVGLLSCLPSAYAQKAAYVVRHAEIPTSMQDPSLSPDGVARAKALARLLGNAHIKAIYTSDVKRTKQTAEPLAIDRGITPTIIPGGDPDATFTKIQAEHADDIVLIVGHSNTVGDLIRKWDPGADITIGEQEFDKIFVVIPEGPEKASCSQFRYRVED
jgi:broad specificity phosphatase PhoE